MTLKQFGQTIKQKYPQYNDLDDEELGKKMLAKYPQYQDMVSDDQPQKPTAQEQPKKSFMQKAGEATQSVGNFLGMSALAKGLGLAAFRLTPEGMQLAKRVNDGTASVEELDAYSKIFGEAPTAKQTIGSAIQTAGNIASAGIGGVAKGAKTLQIAKSATQPLIKTIAQSGATSAVLGAGKATEQGKDALESAKEAFKQGLIGAVTVGVISGAGKMISKTAQKLPERLYNSALQVNKKILLQEKSPSKFMIDKGIFGTLGKVINESQKNISLLDDVIDKKLANSTNTIGTKAIKQQIIEKLQKNFGKAYSKKQLVDIVDGLPLDTLNKGKEINVVEANELRKQLDRILGESYFMSDKQAPVIKEAIGTTTNALRGAVQKASGTAKEFSEMANYIRARDLALGATAQAEKYWQIGFKDLLFGGIVGGGNLLNSVGAITAKKVIGSPAVKTSLAVGQDRINQVITKLPTDSMGKVSRTVVLNAIKELFGQE